MAHVEASQVVPSLDSSVVWDDMYEKVTRDVPKENQSEDSSEEQLMKDCQKF